MAAEKCAECGRSLRTQPRFATKPTPRAKGWWREIEAAAYRFGTPLMPWQKGAARLIGELDAAGLPRFGTVAISVPRQQGKTALSRASIDAKAARRSRQELFGTAQTRLYAARHLEKLGRLLEELYPDDVKATFGVGNERIRWSNGSTYGVIAPTETGGHGDSMAFMLIDEAWALAGGFLGGLRPAMIAVPDAQLLAISTMGTVESVVWNGLVERGRAATENPDADIAYVEYSAERDEDVWDESTWHDYMPALGFTVTHRAIRAAIEDMLADPDEGEAGVVRAFGNRTTSAKTAVFPAEKVAAAWRVIDPPPKFVLAVDVNESPVGAALATGHMFEKGDRLGAAVRIVEYADGSPHWVPSRVAEMVASGRVEAVVADFGGPAKQFEAEIRSLCETAQVAIVARMPSQVAADTARFHQALRDGTLALDNSDALAAAIDGAVRRTGDRGLWWVARTRMQVDASPLQAAIMASGLAAELAVVPKVDVWDMVR